MSTSQQTANGREKAQASSWSFRIATVAGIPIRIHFTFVLFFAWIAVFGSAGGISWPLLILAIFACVVLHELGHALAAQHFGVETRDITLYPIGGIAVLNSQPKPRPEVWIAFAGPAVNLAIATILAAGFIVLHRHLPVLSWRLVGTSFVEALLAANLSLAIFNLIPAFPMDGGRVLRAALALKLPEARATQIAATIGQGLAIVLGFVGLMMHEQGWLLMLVAFFVFLGAGQEMSASLTRSFLSGHKLADAMQSRFRTIPSGASLETAAEMLLAGAQHDFPVMNGDEVLGLLTREKIAEGLATEGPSGYVAGHMIRDFRTANPFMPLEKAIEFVGHGDSTPILVMDDGKLLGMMTVENLSEFIMLEHAKSRGRTVGQI
jgi:Zn-dependent protease/CBS domain-containing protein